VLNELALFAGTGGGILGGKLLGWRTVCAVEIEDYPRRVLMQRQNDGILEPFPIWDDVRTFDGRPWRGIIDVVSGGFPCQDISCAGKGKGIAGSRSGLWAEMARIIGEVRPKYVFIENSPNLRTRGLETVLADLAFLGFDAQWSRISASECQAHHKRDRIWIVAHAERQQLRDESRRGGGENRESTPEPRHDGEKEPLAHDKSNGCGQRRTGRLNSSRPGERKQTLQNMADTKGTRFEKNESNRNGPQESLLSCIAKSWPTEPDVGRVANGVAYRVDRLKALGNGQVPRVVATAWRILSE